MEACTEQAAQYVCHGSPARAPLLRTRTSLRAEGELLVRESELRSRFKRLHGAQRAELARRPTTLRMEGEMETRTEHVERFCEPGCGARRPELSKRRTQLQLEGSVAHDTESRASYAPPQQQAERRQLRRRATNLRLDDQALPLPSSEYRALFADFPQRDPPVRRRPPQGNLAPGPGEMEKVTEKRAHFVDWTGVAERPRPHRRSSSLKLEMEAAGSGSTGLPEYRDRYVEFPAMAAARPAAATRALAHSLRLEGDLLTETEKSAQFVDHYSPVAQRRRQRPPSGGDADPAGSNGSGALPPLAAAAQRPAAGKRTEDQATRDQQEERRLQRLQEQRRQRQVEEEQREQQARLLQLQRELRARPPPAAVHPALEPVFPATAPGFRDREHREREQAQAPLSRGPSLDSPAARRRLQRRASQASTGAGPGAAPATATPPTPRKAPASPARTPPTPRKVRARHQHDKSPPHTPNKSIPKKSPSTPRVGSPSPSVGSGRRRPASASPQRLQQQAEQQAEQQQQQQGKAARPADTQVDDAEEAAANHRPPPTPQPMPMPPPQPQQLLAVPVREEKPAQPPPVQPAAAESKPSSGGGGGCIGGTTDRRLTKLRPEPEAAERRRLRPAAPGDLYRAFHVLEKPEKTVTFEMDVRPPTRGRSVSRSGRGSRCSEDRGSCSLDRALSPGYRLHVTNVDDNGNSAPQHRRPDADADADADTAPRPTSPTARRASSPLPLPRRRGSHIRRDNARHAFIVLDNDNGNNDNGNNSNLNNNNNTTRGGMLEVSRGRGGWVPSWYNAPTSI